VKLWSAVANVKIGMGGGRGGESAGVVTEPSPNGHGRTFVARREGSVLHVTGDIDQANWLEVADRVAAELRAGAVELDLTGVSFFGAAGVRALLHARNGSRLAGPLRVTCSRMVFRVLTICGLENLDGIVVTQDAADLDRPPRAGA
jgi:anti-anti-sigma factor